MRLCLTRDTVCYVRPVCVSALWFNVDRMSEDYVGKLDGNSGWPGVLFTIKLIPSRYQDAFAATPDVRWADQNATVRVIGDGAGEMTYILMDYAGHWVRKIC